MSSGKAVFALALATAAAAGGYVYMNYNDLFKKKIEKSLKQAPVIEKIPSQRKEEPESEEKELENSFFLNSSEAHDKNTATMEEWVTAQIETLLAQNEDGKLFVIQRRLVEQDFFRIMQILNCQQVVATWELRGKLEEVRSALIKEKGIESLDYIKQIVADINMLSDEQADFIEAMCPRLNVGDFVLIESQDHHIGTGEPESINKAYVQKFLDLYLYHPYKNTISKSKEEALEIVKVVQDKASARIAKQDTLGIFDNPVEYLQCYNALCADIAREDFELTEADY